MSAFPFIASSIPCADPTVRTSICTPGCSAEKRLPMAVIIGEIVLEPAITSFPERATVPLTGSLSKAWTPAIRHIDSDTAEMESPFQRVNMVDRLNARQNGGRGSI